MKVTNRTKIIAWLNKMTQDSIVVAPVDSAGKLVYDEIQDESQIVWDFERTDMPPRNWALPMTEPILIIEQGKKTILKVPPAPRDTILFGVRPCDARSFLALDALFLDKAPVDPIYASHRKALTLIGFACETMWDSCFCTVVGGSPDSTEGLDILLTKVKEGYVVEILSEKGEKLAASLDTEDKETSIIPPTLKQGLPTLQSSASWQAQFNDMFWTQLSHSCLSCRACSFVCPTCRCYDVRDERTSLKPGLKEFERLRAWDSCTASGYRRIAGGHNPRDTQTKRLRNRFYCKFIYYPDDFGAMGCVGCGRCIDACPVGIDILEVVARVEQLAEKAAVAG